MSLGPDEREQVGVEDIRMRGHPSENEDEPCAMRRAMAHRWRRDYGRWRS
jgi:hypothetical protein